MEPPSLEQEILPQDIDYGNRNGPVSQCRRIPELLYYIIIISPLDSESCFSSLHSSGGVTGRDLATFSREHSSNASGENSTHFPSDRLCGEVYCVSTIESPFKSSCSYSSHQEKHSLKKRLPELPPRAAGREMLSTES